MTRSMPSIGTAAIAGRPEHRAGRRAEGQTKLQNFSRSNRYGCGGNRTSQNYRDRRPGRRPAKPQLAEAMLFTAGALTRLGAARRRHGGNGLRARGTRIDKSRSAPHFIISTGKRPRSFSPTRPATPPSCPIPSTPCAPSTAWFSWPAPAATLRSNPRKSGPRSSGSDLPRIAFVSRLDRERTSFENAMADLEKSLDAKPVALTLPIGDGTRVQRRDRRARDEGADLRRQPMASPGRKTLSGELKDARRRRRARGCARRSPKPTTRCSRNISNKGELDDDELRAALRAAIVAGKLTPVLCGSGAKNIGIGPLLDAIVDAAARRPTSGPRARASMRQTAIAVERAPDPNAPFSALRLQDRDRSLRRQAVDLPRGLGHAPSAMRTVLNSTRGIQGAFRPAVAPGRQEAVAISTRAAGRDRRGRQAQGYHYRRYAVR